MFTIRLHIRDDCVYVGLFLRQLPLEKFNDSIGGVMKTVFALLYNVKLEGTFT